MEAINKFLSDSAPLFVSNKSKGEINLFIEKLLNTYKINSKNNIMDNLQINILGFDDWLFYIPVKKIEILDIKTNKFLDLIKLNEQFHIDYETIYRGERSGIFENYYLDENGNNFENCSDEVFNKIEDIDQNSLENNVLVFYKKVF